MNITQAARRHAGVPSLLVLSHLDLTSRLEAVVHAQLALLDGVKLCTTQAQPPSCCFNRNDLEDLIWLACNNDHPC